MKRFKVAHVITRLCRGGAQENTFHTVRLANRERFAADLISGPTYGQEGSIEEVVRGAGIAIVRSPHLVRNVSPLDDWLALRHLTELFRGGGYDIVHTHTSKAGYLGRMAARKAGVPILVHTPHGHVFHGYFSRPVTQVFVWMERHAAQWTDRIIALTPRGIEEHLAEGVGHRAQYEAIFSGIDLAPFAAGIARREATRRALGIAPDEILIGGVGRLEPVKGFAYFVEAAGLVAASIPRARFILVGDGALRGELEAQARPLADRFQFLGLRTDVADLMAALDVFVLPSVNEGMGRVLLEAAAAGVPAVASSVGGVPDIVRAGETGVLAAPRDAKGLADAVVSLARQPEERHRLGQAAQGLSTEYGLERMVARIEAVYEALIQEKHLDA